MAIDERARHELHQRLDDAVGAEAAATLMAHLPPAGWGDVVTRDYLDMAIRTQDVRFDTRFERLERKIDGLRHELDGLRHELLGAMRGEMVAAAGQQTRHTIFAMIGTVLSLAALAQVI